MAETKVVLVILLCRRGRAHIAGVRARSLTTSELQHDDFFSPDALKSVSLFIRMLLTTLPALIS